MPPLEGCVPSRASTSPCADKSETRGPRFGTSRSPGATTARQGCSQLGSACAFEAEPARQPILHRGFRQGGGDERKGQRHPDRALALALVDGERLGGLRGIVKEFVRASGEHCPML